MSWGWLEDLEPGDWVKSLERYVDEPKFSNFTYLELLLRTEGDRGICGTGRYYMVVRRGEIDLPGGGFWGRPVGSIVQERDLCGCLDPLTAKEKSELTMHMFAESR